MSAIQELRDMMSNEKSKRPEITAEQRAEGNAWEEYGDRVTERDCRRSKIVRELVVGHLSGGASLNEGQIPNFVGLASIVVDALDAEKAKDAAAGPKKPQHLIDAGYSYQW